MICPVDGSTLVMTERQGVEIDYCPQCRGVWLDRGELDKIIERGTAMSAPPTPPPPPQQQPVQGYPQQQPYRQDQYRRDDGYQHGYGHGYKKKRKESFLGDLFDF